MREREETYMAKRQTKRKRMREGGMIKTEKQREKNMIKTENRRGRRRREA
jgi:hypothetical protein